MCPVKGPRLEVYKALSTLRVFGLIFSLLSLDSPSFRLPAMAANTDALPLTGRQGEPPKARLGLCISLFTLGNSDDSDDEVVFLCSGPLTLEALSPANNKRQARPRKRGHSTNDQSPTARSPCRKRHKALGKEVRHLICEGYWPGRR